jgi:hypothetical protein
MAKSVKLIQSSNPEAQRRIERNGEAISLVAEAAVGLVNVFGMMMQTIVTLAARETIGVQNNTTNNYYYYREGYEPYHLGRERNPAIKSHRMKK